MNLKKGWSFLMATVFSFLLPTLAWADQTIHASGFLRPLILIAVVLIFVIVILWALNFWASDIPAPIGKVVKFAVIFIALIIIIFILLSLVGIRIT